MRMTFNLLSISICNLFRQLQTNRIGQGFLLSCYCFAGFLAKVYYCFRVRPPHTINRDAKSNLRVCSSPSQAPGPVSVPRQEHPRQPGTIAGPVDAVYTRSPPGTAGYVGRGLHLDVIDDSVKGIAARPRRVRTSMGRLQQPGWEPVGGLGMLAHKLL